MTWGLGHESTYLRTNSLIVGLRWYVQCRWSDSAPEEHPEGIQYQASYSEPLERHGARFGSFDVSGLESCGRCGAEGSNPDSMLAESVSQVGADLTVQMILAGICEI